MKRVAMVTGILALAPSASRHPYPARAFHRTTHSMSESQATWSAPAPFPSDDGPRPAVRFSNSATRAGSIFVAGNDIPNLFEIPGSPAPPTLVRDGRRLPSPVPAGSAVIEPRLSVPPNGVVTLLWSSPAADEALDHPLTWISAGGGGIWAAEFTDGAGWSKPVRVVADPVQWSKSFTDRVATAAGMSVFAVPASLQGGSFRGIHCLIWRDHKWTDSRITGILTAGETSAAIANGRIYVAFIGSEAPEHGSNSLYLVISSDAGRTWSAPQLLLGAGQLPLRHPRLRVTRKGVVAFFSRPALNGKQTIGSIDIADDGTGGRPAPTSAEVGGAVNALQVVIDECDAAHLVFEDYQLDGRGALTYLTWRKSGWGKREQLFPGWRAIDPSLSASASSVHLHFLAQPANAPRRSAYGSFESHISQGACNGR